MPGTASNASVHIRAAAVAGCWITALHNQAGIALRLDGDLEAAAAAYDQALHGLRRARRLPSARAAAGHHNLGGLAFAQQRHGDAERLARHSLRLNRRSLPPAPRRVAADLGMLGAIVAAAGRLEEGEQLLRDALATFERRLGPEHREVALALGNLAEVRRARGDDDGARALAVRALAIGNDALGPQHPELAPIVNTLSLASQASGDSREAMRLLARTAGWLEDAVGPQHPALLACRHNLLATAVDEPAQPASLLVRPAGHAESFRVSCSPSDQIRRSGTLRQPSGNDSERVLPARSRAVSRSVSLLRLAVRPAPFRRIRSLPMPARPMLSVAVPTLLPPSRTDARTKHASLHEKRTRSTPCLSAPALASSTGAVLSLPGPGLGCGV